MSKLLISDTCDAIVKRKSDGALFITSETQLAALSASLGINESIFGSIGNKKLAVIKGQKEVTTNFRNAFYDSNFLAMTQGVKVENGSANVYKKEDNLKVVDSSGTLSVTLTGTPVGTTVHVTNSMGETKSTTVASSKVTVPTAHAKKDELVSVTYQANVTGEIVALDSDKFAEAYSIEYHTIGYDPAKNIVVKDIYIQLDHVVPQGDFELSFENGSPIAPEISFDCLNEPNTNKIGRVIEVNRV